MNRNKFYSVNELKKWLVNIWQSAADHYWCNHRQMDKTTDSVHACRQTDNIMDTCCEPLIRPEKNHGQIKWK